MHCPTCLAAGTSRLPISHCEHCGHSWWTQAIANAHDESYDGYRFDPVFAQRVRSFFDTSLASRLPQNAKILDVGCGAGEFIQTAQQAGHQAVGIDISPDAVAICQSKGLPATCTNFITQDVGSDFDLITFWDVMEHLVEPAPFLRRAYDLLRPGGLVFAKIPYFGPLSLRAAHYTRLAGPLLGAPDHIQYYSENSVRALCARRLRHFQRALFLSLPPGPD
jgi:2-polyprenyl-3-methyl-5-hydroxy-6-metoxy-1,4-benzoquinol methylase